MIRKVRIKFICVNMLIVACMLILMFGLLFYTIRKNIVQDQITMMQRIAEDTGHDRPFGRGSARVGLSFFYFTLEPGPDGALYCQSSSGFDLEDEEDLQAMYDRACADKEQTGIFRDLELRYLRIQTPHGDKVVFADIASEQATIRHLLIEVIAVGIGSFAIFLIISVLLSKWAVKPVDEAWKQQKQFVADASHELKTPLAVIMANAELLQQPNHDDAEKRRFSENIHEMSRQMRHLVESLLDLARLDSAQEPPQTAELDFSALCEEAALPFEAVYFERGLLLETEIDPGIRVQGVEQSLRQVVDILLDNAQKYSLPGTVTLTLRQTNHNCILTVSNPSPELSREECRNIFKRFYRIDESRTRSGSYGLGLPIAESIVTRFGGKIVCEYAEGEARFTVTLPTVCGK